MLFNSLQFALFFPLVCGLYFSLPHRWRTLLLLMASCVFYMAFIPEYIVILAVTIAIDYLAGLGIEHLEGRPGRRLLLILSIIATCLVLFIFKYFNFFTGTFNVLVHAFGSALTAPSLAIILPIGLSFHTFQSLSYVIEVYRGHQRAERNFITYATYVMFFPQLVAGPIERPQNLLHQFSEHHEFEYVRVKSGLKRMGWGFFKKLVIADRLALYVNDVYASPQDFNGLQLTIATFFFAYQIYCDFSGYSDIAIGTARVLGFKLMENFDTPYYSRSVGEFWRRWHISLSTWFRDYVYIPMGGSRTGPGRQTMNVMVTFAVSGLWHGANWTYVIWGSLNGAYLVAGRILAPLRQSVFAATGLRSDGWIRHTVMIATTFVLTCFAWVVFRAKSVEDAWYVFTHLASNWDVRHIVTEHFLLRQMPVALAGILVLEVGHFCRGRIELPQLASRLPLLPRWAFYAGAVVTISMLGIYGEGQFIYFQF